MRDAIAIGVKFDMLRSDRQMGNIGLIMRRDGVARIASTGLVGSREMHKTLFRPLLLRGIKILYCIIEKFHESGKPFSLDDVVNSFKESSGLDNHAYDRLIRLYGDGFPINESIARVSSNYRSEFVVTPSPEAAHKDSSTLLTDFFDTLVSELKGEGRIGTARTYRSTLKTITDFLNLRHGIPGGANPEAVDLRDVDGKFVRAYYKYLAGRDISPETIGFYMRVFRTMLKTAAERGTGKFDNEWFAEINTSVGKVGANSDSKVLDKDTLLRLSGLDLSDNPELALSRDLFMFAFYCKGMELTDVLNLTHSNFDEGFIVYRRRQKGVEVRIKIEPPIQTIIDRYRRPGSEYVFPILENRDSSYFFSARNVINRDLRAIGKMMKLEKSLTFNMNIYTWKSLAEHTNLSCALIS